MAFSVSYTYNLLDRYSAPLRKISKVQQRFNDTLRKSRARLSSFSSKIDGLEGAFIGLAGAFGAAKILDTFNLFETSMNRLSAVSMATKGELVSFRNMALKLGATTPFTGAQVAQGMVFLKQAGLETKEVLEAIPASLNLAAAGNLSLAEAADISTNVLLQQGLATKDLNRIVDNLATVQSTSNTNVLEAGNAMKNVLTTTAKLGFEVEHTTALIGAMANAGLKDAEAGTLLRNAVLRLVNPTRKARRTFRKLRIDLKAFTTPEGKIKNFNKLLTVLQKQGATTTDIFNIFQERGARAILALMRTGEVGVNKLIALQKAGVDLGMASEMAERQMQGIPGMILSFKSAVEALEIALVETGLAKIITDVGNALTNIIRGVTKGYASLISFAAVFGGLTAIMAGVISVFKLLAPVLAVFLTKIGLIFVALAAYVGMVVTFYKKSQKVRTAVKMIWKAFEPMIAVFADFINLFGDGTGVADAFGSSLLILANIISGIMAPFNWLFRKISSFLKILKTEGKGKAFKFLFGFGDTKETKKSWWQKVAGIPGGIAEEFRRVRRAGEYFKLSELQDSWQLNARYRRLTKGNQSDLPLEERSGLSVTPQMLLNGTIKIETDEGSKVKEAELTSTLPGNLGFNMMP
jgi:TP901 family phage tail tape measure protein